MKASMTLLIGLFLGSLVTLVQDKAPTDVDLIQRIESLEHQVRSKPVVHHGNVERTLAKGQLAKSIKVDHDLTQYKEFSIVACESGTSGTLVMAKAERFADDHFYITLRRHNDSGHVNYEARIAWILVGTSK